MKVIYIRELQNTQEESLYQKVRRRFNVLEMTDINENRKIIDIPRIDKENVYKKINRLLINLNDKNISIVLSNKLKKYATYFGNYNIIDGVKIKKYMLNDILNFIFNIYNKNECETEIDNNKIKIENQDIYFCVNDYNTQNLQMIEFFIEKAKTINIITKNIEKFKIIEEKIMQEKGILITISNNKYKSLKKAKIIVNIDMPDELCTYSVNRNAIIINLSKQSIKPIRAFEGIIINNVKVTNGDIEVPEVLQEYNFENTEIIESMIIQKSNYTENMNLTKKMNIIYLIGNNGKISEKELKSTQLFLTKSKN